MANWWNEFVGSVESILGVGSAPSNPIGNFLSSISGQIGSAIESGFIAILKDLWDVILGPLEIIAGAVIIAMAFLLLFKNDLIGIARVAGARA